MESMTLITDCRDANALGRVITRMISLYPVIPSQPIGVISDLEAAMNVVDLIAALNGAPGVILVNVAPRNGHAKIWPNGTPFGYLRVGKASIFGTIAGYTFSLLQKILGERLEIDVFDIPEVVKHFELSPESRDYITSTQFRSLEFLPRVAATILTGTNVPTKKYAEVPDMPDTVVWVDCFGNVKTSFLAAEVGFEPGSQLVVTTGEINYTLKCYERLKDVPDNEAGFVIGSSGLRHKRLLEIVINGGRASDLYNLKSGDELKVS